MEPREGVIWTPSSDVIDRANITRFMRAHSIDTYEELVARSVDDVEWFWDAVVEDLDLAFHTPYRQVLDTSRGIEWATWFVGGTLNVAHQCVDRWSTSTPDAPAVIGETEDGDVRTWSYARLRRETDRLARGLRALGVAPGDRVGIYLPMVPEAVAAMMACAKIGAVSVPIFSGFGTEAVAARLANAGARVMITADASLRKGRPVPMKAIADAAADLAGCVERTVVWERLPGSGVAWRADRDVRWDDLATDDDPLPSEMLDAEHPFMLGYTSGTTGTPKGVVHVHGGLLVKIAEEAAYQADLHRDELLYWVTDLGWIMGPWEILGSLALGASVLVVEGAPTHPGPERLWETVERHRVHVLGVSPTLIRAQIPAGISPAAQHDLRSLRILASTGEPWNPEPYRWLFREAGRERLPIINISGGTEVGACFLSPLPICELKPCTLRGPALGMAVDVRRADGTSAGPGEVGELVCTKPWPGMTRGIWGDPERYLETYWRRWPGVWTHSDWASRDEDGFWFLHGRSDDTLSIAGKRIGPAEIESVLVSHPGVVEAAAVGVADEVKGEQVWCFVVTSHDADPGELRRLVAERLGGSFTPARILAVPELPRTSSAKIVRRALRAVAEGADVGDLSSVENPGALEAARRAVEA